MIELLIDDKLVVDVLDGDFFLRNIVTNEMLDDNVLEDLLEALVD